MIGGATAPKSAGSTTELMPVNTPVLSLILRITAGVLALACLVLVALRLYYLFVVDIELEPGEGFVNVLRILFPLSLGLIAAYIAVKGGLPFGESRDDRKQ